MQDSGQDESVETIKVYSSSGLKGIKRYKGQRKIQSFGKENLKKSC